MLLKWPILAFWLKGNLDFLQNMFYNIDYWSKNFLPNYDHGNFDQVISGLKALLWILPIIKSFFATKMFPLVMKNDSFSICYIHGLCLFFFYLHLFNKLLIELIKIKFADDWISYLSHWLNMVTLKSCQKVSQSKIACLINFPLLQNSKFFHIKIGHTIRRCEKL